MTQSPPVQHLSPAELDALMRSDTVTLVDVREPGEHAAERIEGAVLHPLSSFEPSHLPPGQLVFHCGVGKRSLTAIQHCVRAGLPHVAHLAGGIAAWKQAGLPTQR